MASKIYPACLEGLLAGQLRFADDAFRVMLVTSSYKPALEHRMRSHVYAEASGVGYSPGGLATQARVEGAHVTFAPVRWPMSSITARGAVLYRASSNQTSDLLIAYLDFGADMTSIFSVFSVTFSSPLCLQG